MKKIIFLLAPLLVILLFGFGVTQARNFGALNAEDTAQKYTQMFQFQADALGIPVDEVKNAWAQGKTIQEIIDEKGINEDEIRSRLDNMSLQQTKDEMDALVNQGVITREQAEQRINFFQEQISQQAEKIQQGVEEALPE